MHVFRWNHSSRNDYCRMLEKIMSCQTYILREEIFADFGKIREIIFPRKLFSFRVREIF